jgi:Zn-dependent protease/CBS domain-containing protein
VSDVPIARLAGFEIRLHVSWIVVLAVITATVGSRIDSLDPGAEPLVRWLIGAGVAGAFLASALAHELGHAVVARRMGVTGGPVVVYFFGGAATAVLETRRPRDEATVALAGPLVSLVLGGAALAFAGIVGPVGGSPAAILAQIALVVGILDLVLGGVNLVPGYPLDGGRVVRALAWARSGDPVAGLLAAARTGRWLGMGLAAIGTGLILAVDSTDGLMLALCGWLLISTGRAVERTAGVERLLEGIRVGEIMEPEVTRVPAGLTLDTFADQVVDGPEGAVSVVRGSDFVGMLGIRQIRRVGRSKWSQTHAGDIMTGTDALPTIDPDTTVRAALEHLTRTGLDGLPVMVDGTIGGVVTRRAVADAIRRAGARRGSAA